MKDCYSAKAIEDMFFYAQLHMFIEFVLLVTMIVLGVYVWEKLFKDKKNNLL
jgi:hypothetical protein